MTTDWISPAWGAARGGGTVFVISSPVTALQMQRALKQKGIDTWAWQPLGSGATFKVGRSQERHARSVLKRLGAFLV